MTVPDIIKLDGTVHQIIPDVKYSPYTASWWIYTTITRIPETSVGWLTAQGWQIISSYTEESCGQTFYTMTRKSMNSWMILQSLLNEYTQAYNEGRAANSLRYNDVVAYWVDAIDRAGEQLDVIGDVSDNHLAIYIDQMDALVQDVESEMALAKDEMTDAGDELATQLSQYLAKLNTLQGIYDTHEATSEAFLVDLGVAELARINEQFDSALSKSLQSLTDRGMYSSALVTSVTARVERERSEAITQLNDRLAREKLDNEHKLYEQEMGVNQMVLDGRVKHNAALMTKSQFLVETRKGLALTVMQARMGRVAGRMDIRDREEKLMAYQLDTHNNLAIGLWNFIERRSDEYPSMESISKLVAGLGDAGGGWVTP